MIRSFLYIDCNLLLIATYIKRHVVCLNAAQWRRNYTRFQKYIHIFLKVNEGEIHTQNSQENWFPSPQNGECNSVNHPYDHRSPGTQFVADVIFKKIVGSQLNSLFTRFSRVNQQWNFLYRKVIASKHEERSEQNGSSIDPRYLPYELLLLYCLFHLN